MADLAPFYACVPTIDALRVSGDGAWVFWTGSGLSENAEVWCAPTDGSAAPKQLTSSADHAYVRGVNIDGTAAIFARSTDSCERDQLFIVTRDGAETPLTHPQRDHYLFGGEFSPDGTKAIWVADFDYATVSATTGGWIWTQDLVPGAGGKCAILAYTDSIFSPTTIDGTSAEPIANLTGRESILSLGSHPDGSWIGEAYDAGAPHDIVRVSPDGQVTVIAQSPQAGRFICPVMIHWTSPDGERIQVWLYRPKGRPNGHVTYVHGGPTWHSEDWMNPKIQFWLALGYSLLDPYYRGSTGRGMHRRNKVRQDGWGGREQADIRAGTEAAIAATGAPRDKIAIAGNSYGGFSSWFGIARHHDIYTAAIPMCRMYRLDNDYAETAMPWGRSYSEEMMSGSPEDFPEKYANASPGNLAADIRGKVLVVHGLADTNVGLENTHVAVRDMTALGKAPEVLLFADEGHGVTRRSNLTAYLAATADFLARAFGDD